MTKEKIVHEIALKKAQFYEGRGGAEYALKALTFLGACGKIPL